MLTSASPGRGGGDGAGAGRAQRATGSSTTIANSAAPTVVALSLAGSALRSCGSERSAEFGSVNHAGCGHARARRRQFQRAVTPTDLHRPARRRCGCWPTSTFLFSFPSGLAGPAAHETLPFCGRVVGIEVGIRLARLSPLFSWTRGSWSTSDCRHGPSSVPEHAS